MSTINDGGPAFPVSTRGHDGVSGHGPYGHQNSANSWQFPGMTLRDYFAAKAMHALSSGDIADLADKDGVDGEPVVAYMARTAYHMADAMLAARGGA